jgi:uncharacterized protein YecE (DUF72 family)
MALFIGTSGWAYKEWKPAFYPEKLAQARFLEHYARELSACEINATFYRLQSGPTFEKWAKETPEAFRFAVKAHRAITHGQTIAPEQDFLDVFLRSVATLGPRLGVVLFQLPPYRARDDEALERLMKALPSGRRYAFEFRHASWEKPEVAERIAAGGGTVCHAETEGTVPERLPPGPVAYVRLRAERYAPGTREAWRALLEREARSRDVYAFAKHEGVPAGDPFAGVGLAQWLAKPISSEKAGA